MPRHTPDFTFGPRREPGVYFPPQRGVWLRVVAIVTVFAAIGVALVVFLSQL